jgi:AcrR family transcriptional regulator
VTLPEQGSPRRRGKRRSTKELLFQAAMALIGERGYSGASVDAIAAKAGVAKGIVYYYFDSKAALAEQLIASGLGFLAERLERAALAASTPAEAIAALAAEEIKQVEKRRDFAKFLLSEMWHEDRAWRETLSTCISRITSIFSRVIQAGIDEGSFAPQEDAEARDFLAQMLFATFLAAALNRTVLNPELPPDTLSKRLSTHALAMLKAPPAA